MTTRYFVPQRSHTHLIGREAELREIMARLSSPDDRVGVVTIEGVAGLGKSAIAQEVAWRYIEEHERLSSDARFDVIIWATARERASSGQAHTEPVFTTLDDVFRSVAAALEIPTLMQVSPDERPKQCWAALQLYRGVLLVIDNLEADVDDSISGFLRNLPEGTRALVTTQFHENLPYPLRLRPLEPPAARELLATTCAARGIVPANQQLEALAAATQGMPLAAHLVTGLCAQNGAEAVASSLADLHTRVSSALLGRSVAQLKQQHPESYRCLLAFALFDSVGGATGTALAACLGVDATAAGQARAHLEYLNLVQPVQELATIATADPAQPGLQQLDAVLRERDTAVRYAVLPITHRYLQRELAQQRDWEHRARARQRDYYQRVAASLDDPAHYAAAAPEAANLITVMRALASVGEVDHLASFFAMTQEFLFAQGYWDELLAFAGHLFEAGSRGHNGSSRAMLGATLIALLQSPIDIYRRRTQMVSHGVAWVSAIQAASSALRDRVLEAEIDLARRRLLCNDGTLGTTMKLGVISKLSAEEIDRYLRLEDPNFADDVKSAVRTFKDAGRADKVFQAHATLGNFYRVRGDFERAQRYYGDSLTVLSSEQPRSASWREARAAVVRAGQALIAGRMGRYAEACEALGAVRVGLVDAVDRVEADVARAYYEFQRGNRERALVLRTGALAGKVSLGLRDVPLCLEDERWVSEVEAPAGGPGVARR